MAKSVFPANYATGRFDKKIYSLNFEKSSLRHRSQGVKQTRQSMDAQIAAASRQKLQRVTQACDFCHQRCLKCVQPTSNPTVDDCSSPGECLTCVKYGQQCTRNRKPKKRGTKPRPKPAEDAEDCASCTSALAPSTEHDHSPQTLPPAHGAHPEHVGPHKQTHCSHIPHNSPGFSPTRETVAVLMNIYLDSIYPLYAMSRPLSHPHPLNSCMP